MAQTESIKVLIVDDAVVVRKILSDVLSQDEEIEVVGVAANGRIALQKIPQLNPDIITLDVEMPDLNGIETLRELRKGYPKLPVIMFSTLTEKGTGSTVEALAAGASDYVCKPANVGSVTEAMQKIKVDLIPKIKILSGKKPFKLLPIVKVKKEIQNIEFTNTAVPAEIVAIGVSTGGPNALSCLFEKLPGDLSVPIVIVQHMPATFTQLLAERLDSVSPLTILEGADGMPLEVGKVYIAPGGYHMVLKRSRAGVIIETNQDAPENSCRPAVDPLFRSVAKCYGNAVLAVVMTGMGRDGCNGCEYIKESGGRVLVQDKESSVVWGMPGHVAESGLADSVIPLTSLPTEIVRLVRQ